MSDFYNSRQDAISLGVVAQAFGEKAIAMAPTASQTIGRQSPSVIARRRERCLLVGHRRRGLGTGCTSIVIGETAEGTSADNIVMGHQASGTYGSIAVGYLGRTGDQSTAVGFGAEDLVAGRNRKPPRAIRRAAVFAKSGNGAPNRIRTCGLRIRNPTLYPAELWVPAAPLSGQRRAGNRLARAVGQERQNSVSWFRRGE